jgi:hypothetical protein
MQQPAGAAPVTGAIRVVATLAINYATQYTSIILSRDLDLYLHVTETGKRSHTRPEERQMSWK